MRLGETTGRMRSTPGGDWPPIVLTKMPDVSFYEGTTDRGVYRLSDYFADPDGSLLFWTVGNSRIGVTIRANGSVDLTSAVGWWGTEAVTFRATDPQGALQEDSVRIRVIHVDRPPAFGVVPDEFREGVGRGWTSLLDRIRTRAETTGTNR